MLSSSDSGKKAGLLEGKEKKKKRLLQKLI